MKPEPEFERNMAGHYHQGKETETGDLHSQSTLSLNEEITRSAVLNSSELSPNEASVEVKAKRARDEVNSMIEESIDYAEPIHIAMDEDADKGEIIVHYENQNMMDSEEVASIDHSPWDITMKRNIAYNTNTNTARRKTSSEANSNGDKNAYQNVMDSKDTAKYENAACLPRPMDVSTNDDTPYGGGNTPYGGGHVTTDSDTSHGRDHTTHASPHKNSCESEQDLPDPNLLSHSYDQPRFR